MTRRISQELGWLRPEALRAPDGGRPSRAVPPQPSARRGRSRTPEPAAPQVTDQIAKTRFCRFWRVPGGGVEPWTRQAAARLAVPRDYPRQAARRRSAPRTGAGLRYASTSTLGSAPTGLPDPERAASGPEAPRSPCSSLGDELPLTGTSLKG